MLIGHARQLHTLSNVESSTEGVPAAALDEEGPGSAASCCLAAAGFVPSDPAVADERAAAGPEGA